MHIYIQSFKEIPLIYACYSDMLLPLELAESIAVNLSIDPSKAY